MSRVPELVVVLDFCLIAALPRIFFRPGTLHRRWLLTAAPFGLAAGAVLAAWLGLWAPWDAGGSVALLPYVGVGLGALSLHLMVLAIGANHVPLALWHQDDDAPVEIVTRGPYAGVRHPFYTSFLATLLAAVCVAPGVPTMAPALLGWVAMEVTARREERRLLASPLGGAYARYAAATGRFLPAIGRLGRPAAATLRTAAGASR